MAKLLVLQGPNLNLLGVREPERYGSQDLAALHRHLKDLAGTGGHALQAFQSNAEHELIERIHRAREEGVDAILFNPAAFTHTSIALRDALLAVAIPFFEVHISNVHAREPFRHHSYFSDIASGIVVGFGVAGYELALRGALARLSQPLPVPLPPSQA